MPDSSVRISQALFEQLDQVVKSSGGAFSSVEDYVNFVLTETVKEMKVTQGLSPQDEKEVQDRLKKLGYV